MATLFVIHAEADSSSAEITESGRCGPDAYYAIYSDGTLKIDGCGEMYHYNGLERAPWYVHRDVINNIVIDDDITQLGAWAFVGLTHVTELTIPITLDTVVCADNSAFAGCYNIETVYLTCGNSGYGFDYAASYGYNCWYQLTPWYQSRDNIKEIIFEDGITHIGMNAFRELNITSLVIPDSVTSIGGYCFYDCRELTDLTVPMSLGTIGDENFPAFWGCTAVENVKITRGNGTAFNYEFGSKSAYAPWNINHNVVKNIVIADDVVSMGLAMFENTSIGELTAPISAEIQASGAFLSAPFGGYPALEKVTITKGTGIGAHCFLLFPYGPWYNAPNLKILIIEEGVTYIDDYTFDGCCAEKIVLPSSLKTVDGSVFCKCKVKDLTIPVTLDLVADPDFPAFDGCEIERLTITAGTDGIGIDYHNGAPVWCTADWRISEIVIEEGVKHIGAHTFEGYTFVGADGEPLEPTAENLSGHTFTGTDGEMHIVEETQEIPADPVCTDLTSVVKTDTVECCC